MPTFLFTDIEGSTTRWEKYGASMAEALARHDSILQAAISRAGGRLVKHTGDGMIAVFTNGNALVCAVDAQTALQRADWAGVGGLQVRMCAFAGEAEERDDDFFGPALNGAARMMSAAWGGQVLVNDRAAASEVLPGGASLADAGVHVLRDLLEPQQIHVLTHPSLPAEFPALRTVSSRPQNLPVQPTPFLGRACELDEVCAMLENPGTRLLTILAPGGTGKSRLSLQAAARLITGFRHGAFFVRLEDVPSAAMIPAAIASAMSLRFSGPVPEEEQLASFLADSEVLVIADNFEHLSKDSPILSRLLGRAPGLKIIVTSRHRLNIREERVYALRGMGLPDPDGSNLEQCDASGLFLASAERSEPGYLPAEADRPGIADVCSILDGSPLGIELAASWVRLVPPGEIALELRRNFELLDSAPLDMPGRHRGLEAVFEYSWSLLGAREQDALSALAVFSGEFEHADSTAVAGAGLPVLRGLVDKSLLQCPSQGRFGMHPIVRAYAAAKLASDPARRDELAERHARHFADKMREEAKTKQSGSAKSLARVESALPNLVQAWDHAVRHWQAADMRVFFVVLSNLFIVRSTLATAIQVFGERLAVCRERWGATPDPSQAAVLSSILERLATFRNLSGARTESRPLLDEALDLAARSDDRELEPRILGTLGVMEAQTGHGSEARRCFERMLEKLEEIGVISQMSVALTNLANLEFLDGNYDKSTEYFSRSLEIARQQGDVLNQMRTLGSMGFMLVNAGRGERALACLGESLEIARTVGDKRSEELALLGMADLLAGEDPARAEELVQDCLLIADAIEHISMQGHAWLVYATIHARLARHPEARQAVDRAVAILGDMIDAEARKRIEEIEGIIAANEGRNPQG